MVSSSWGPILKEAQVIGAMCVAYDICGNLFMVAVTIVPRAALVQIGGQRRIWAAGAGTSAFSSRSGGEATLALAPFLSYTFSRQRSQ